MTSILTNNTEETPTPSVSVSRESTPHPMNVLEPYKRAGQRLPLPGTVAVPQQDSQSASDAHHSTSLLPTTGSSPSRQDGDARLAEGEIGNAEDYSGGEPNFDAYGDVAPLDRPRDDDFDEMERRARVALETIATRDNTMEQHMGEYVEVLQGYRTACQARAMYREAYLVQQVLRNLRLEEESRHVRGITERQMEERRMLEEAHREEFREFHHSWNARIDAFEEEQVEAEIVLRERQNEELKRFQEEMRDFQPRLIRYSRSLLESRLRQQTLARQRDYVGAQAQKVQADAIELNDIDNFENARIGLFQRREYALQHRHYQELCALRLKMESRRLYLERYRKQELDVLLQRYINIRRSMESQQNIVRNKTGTLLLRHACNMKTDSSGTAVLVECAHSGTFGTVVQRRHGDELRSEQRQQGSTSRSENVPEEL